MQRPAENVIIIADHVLADADNERVRRAHHCFRLTVRTRLLTKRAARNPHLTEREYADLIAYLRVRADTILER